MWSEEKLNEMLVTPSDELIADMKKIKGDIMVLGAGGKMGPSLCVLAKKAAVQAGENKRIFAVSRFGDAESCKYLNKNGVETISCDLTNAEDLNLLPQTENIIYMAGKKFGTAGNEWQTWGMNAAVPAFVSKFAGNSNIVVFSSGNIYPLVEVTSGGCREETAVQPIGDYAMSCLARERVFEFGAHNFGNKVLIFRLNFAVDLRYGVLYDVAKRILNREPISLDNPCFNFIWQGKANEDAIRSLLHCTSPATVLNVTGTEVVYVKDAAGKMGKLLGIEPIFKEGTGKKAFLSNASKATEMFGSSPINAETLIKWQAEWLKEGLRVLDKPTHFEETGGTF